MAEIIGITADHGGRALKARIIEALKSQWEFRDFGSHESDGSVDYPDYAERLAKAVAHGEVKWGIAICGTGIGMSIAANKVPGIRAALAWSESTAKLSRQHNDSNVLCLGERILDPDEAVQFAKVWLSTPFDGGRHAPRVAKLEALDRTACENRRSP